MKSVRFGQIKPEVTVQTRRRPVHGASSNSNRSRALSPYDERSDVCNVVIRASPKCHCLFAVEGKSGESDFEERRCLHRPDYDGLDIRVTKIEIRICRPGPKTHIRIVRKTILNYSSTLRTHTHTHTLDNSQDSLICMWFAFLFKVDFSGVRSFSGHSLRTPSIVVPTNHQHTL